MNTNTTDTTTENSQNSDRRSGTIAGAALILIGLIALAAQFVQSSQLAMFIPLILGLIFLAWGLITRSLGLLIPGGILAGIGAGVVLMTGQFIETPGEAQAGVFMLAFAAGWLLITLLSPLTSDGFQWWPLIPGGIIGLVGLALVGGGVGLELLKIAGYAWPLILVGFGLYLLLKRRN